MTQTKLDMRHTDAELDTRLDGASLDIAAEKRRELIELFPEVEAKTVRSILIGLAWR